ncbi:MAG: hypothetical protein V4686_00710 [Patescibacteria group bacterium]
MRHTIKFIFIFLIIALLGVLGFAYNYEEKPAPVEGSGSVVLEGTYECLPYIDTAPTENRVCDYGLITDTGEMYAVDFNQLLQAQAGLSGGDRIKAQGIFTPIETLSSDYLTKRYSLKGIFSVTDSFEVLEKNNSTSNGVISFDTPQDFGLATTVEQILVTSYIPPCDPNFDYCLYFNGKEYQNTNFGSAGIRIKKRTDLATVDACINTPPEGYVDMKPTNISSTGVYILSSFPIGDAGMGHYASGELYRLSYRGVCHEFETRISATQLANYPEGTKVEFKDEVLKERIKNVLQSVELAGGEVITF